MKCQLSVPLKPHEIMYLLEGLKNLVDFPGIPEQDYFIIEGLQIKLNWAVKYLGQIAVLESVTQQGQALGLPVGSFQVSESRGESDAE